MDLLLQLRRHLVATPFNKAKSILLLLYDTLTANSTKAIELNTWMHCHLCANHSLTTIHIELNRRRNETQWKTHLFLSSYHKTSSANHRLWYSNDCEAVKVANHTYILSSFVATSSSIANSVQGLKAVRIALHIHLISY